MSKGWDFITPGIPDEFFIRGRVPMTKEEIRVVTLAKARLFSGMTVWDVGSGTGSIAVEAARLVPGGQVYAVEKSVEGLELIEKNILHFGLENITVIPGEAPEALKKLPSPHRVIIGGSGGRFVEIISLLEDKLLPGGRVVLNAVTLETVAVALDRLCRPWRTEIVQLAVARGEKVGKSHLMRALNPVYIITAWKKEEGDGR